MQTDPNWGNFLYNEATKTINLIDFGAARDFPKSFVDDYLRMVGSFPFYLIFFVSETTTTTKPYPTKWGRLHGSNYAIMFYPKPYLVY